MVNTIQLVTFIKMKGTGEILGGYNPITWKSSDPHGYGKTADSFIFSFKYKDNFIKGATISNVEKTDYAICYNNRAGPYFGEDIVIFHDSNEFTDYNETFCRKRYYEKNIRDTENQFSIEDFEVFQIIKRQVRYDSNAIEELKKFFNYKINYHVEFNKLIF